MSEQAHDVLVIGAGPAGLSVASTLARIGIAATVVDRDGVGASFRRWPPGMRLITPSFTGNQFGLVDLNAITPDTSPALSLQEEHPTGDQHAASLKMVADLDELDVRTGTDVRDVRPRDDGDLEVVVADGPPLIAHHVVWAAGEAGCPRRGGFPGAEHTQPTIEVRSWAEHPGDHVVIVGGYESGIDAAVNLVGLGREVTVIDPSEPWQVVDADPSLTLVVQRSASAIVPRPVGYGCRVQSGGRRLRMCPAPRTAVREAAPQRPTCSIDPRWSATS